MDDFSTLPYLGQGDPARLSESFLHEGQFFCVACRNDGTMVYVTESVRQLLGFEPTEIVGRNILDLIHPDDLERAILQLSSAEGGKLVTGVTRFDVLHKSGAWGPLEVFGGAVWDGHEELIGIYARRPLHQVVLEDILAMLVRGMPREEVLVPVCDVIQWREHGSHLAISWEDEGLHQVDTGLPELLGGGDRRTGTPWGDGVSPDSNGLEGLATDLPPDMAEAAREAGLAMWWVTAVGWSVSSPPALITVWTRGDRITPQMHSYGLGVARNMVELILGWSLTQRRLIAQSKLASLGSMVTGIAHEIRNPLNFIVNFAEAGREAAEDLSAVSKDLADPRALAGAADVSELFDLIAKHAGRIEDIVGAMLRQSQGESEAAELVNLSELVRTFTELGYQGYRSAGRQDFEASVSLQVPEQAPATVFPRELGRVIVNLVENACASMYERAMVEPGHASDLLVSLERMGATYRLVVQDNGQGISRDIVERIFEPFFTTKAPGSGTGLGLAMCHEIVNQLHGGSLSVESAPGATTRFIATLPVDGPAQRIANRR